MIPNKGIVTLPGMYTVFVITKKGAQEDVSAASSELHAQTFVYAREKNVLHKFLHRYSRILHKICKYKGFSPARGLQKSHFSYLVDF